MSCYFRHMKDVLEAAGVEITKENKKQMDKIIHELVDVEYKECSSAWKAVKEHIKEAKTKRSQFIQDIKKMKP